jgi:hypothetical protein
MSVDLRVVVDRGLYNRSVNTPASHVHVFGPSDVVPKEREDAAMRKK